MYQLAKSHDYGINTCQQCLVKQREIDRLTEENQRLRAKLSQQKRKDQEGFFGSSTPSAQIPVKANSTEENHRKRGGAKPGHKGHGRKKHTEQEADCIRTVCVEPFCPACHSELIAKDYRERSVLDIDPVKVKRVLYRLECKECPCCGVSLTATTPGVLPKALLSNQLLTEIVDAHYVQGTPLGRVCARWQLNYGTVIQALHRLGGICAPVMEELKRDYGQAFVRHADETTWRTDGESGYCWLFASEQVSLHLYRNTRSGRVVEEVLGTEPLAGYLVVDRYAGYNRAPCKVQYCSALANGQKGMAQNQPSIAGSLSGPQADVLLDLWRAFLDQLDGWQKLFQSPVIGVAVRMQGGRFAASAEIWRAVLLHQRLL